MPRESAADKARRYLSEGRVTLLHVDTQRVRAIVRGDGTLHRTSWDHRGWWCTCPARGRCAHLLALGHIIAVDIEAKA